MVIVTVPSGKSVRIKCANLIKIGNYIRVIICIPGLTKRHTTPPPEKIVDDELRDQVLNNPLVSNAYLFT